MLFRSLVYRNPVLQGNVKDYVYQLIRETMEAENIVIQEMNVETDHVMFYLIMRRI